MPLAIQSRRVGHVAVICCSGRIVAGEEAAALERAVNGYISNHTNVVINLGEVSFIDSSGLGLLVRLTATTRHTQAGLRYCGVSEQMRKVLELTKLTSVLSIHPSEAQAIAAFSAKASGGAGGSSKCGNILCVDESPDLLAYLREALEHAGFHTQSARTLPDATLLLKAMAPTLVIAGPQLAPRIAPRAADMKIPMIALESDFSTRDAGEAVGSLLQAVRAQLGAGTA